MKNLIGLFFILLTGFNYSNAQPGQLDPSFGNGGKVIIQNLNDNTPRTEEGMAIQPDGKIILAGSTVNQTFNRGYDFMVFRLMPDGKLDSSFGENGSVVIDYVPNPAERDPRFDDLATDVAIAPDGKIVVAGGSQRFHNGVWESNTLVVRLNPNGSKDIGFDGDGIKAINLVSGYETAEAVSILSDNKILLAGRLAKIYSSDPFGSGSPYDMMVIKLKADGQLDESFGLNGVSLTDMGHSEKANAMIVQQDGKIIIGGDIYYASANNHDFAVVRLLADGNPDPSFSGDGILVFSINMSALYEWVNSIAIQQDEKIVITGYYQENNFSEVDIPVARINKDGTLDFGFDYGGTKLIRINGSVEEAYVVLMDPRNNILIGAVAQQVQFGDYDFAVFRLTPEGILDARFDGDGKTYVNFGREDVFRSMQLQPDGKIVLGGTSEYPGPDRSYAIARLLYESNPLLVARATYIGPEILGTPCYGCQTAIIPLRATVTGPRNQPDDTDPSSTDIRSARVKFVDRDNNTDITGWITASKLIEPNDFSMATVDATWYVTLSYAQPVKKVRVGMVVDFGDSIRNDPADDATITLYMPHDDVISGGGELFVSATSKGKYKANEGSVTMFGFYAQLKPNMPQPSGYMNMWFSGKNQAGNTVTYKLEINTVNGLGVNNSSHAAKNAEFQGTGKLWEQTGGSARVLVEDNVTVHTKLIDGGAIPEQDALTVYIWSSNNILIHTSNWFLNKAVPQSLFAGQVTVHSGSSFDEGSSAVITQRIHGKEKEVIKQKGFSVAVLNNPTSNAFSLNVNSNESNVYSIRVTDLTGRIIEFRNNVPVSQTLQFGSRYGKGLYFAEIRQGKNVRTIKLVKH